MAQLMQRSMGGPDNGGMLPMVKCSSCGVPVPMDELGEHVCAPAPAPSSYRDRGRGGDDYYEQGHDQRDVTRQPSGGRSRLAPPEPRAPPSQGQSRRSPGGPSGGYNNGYGNASPNAYDKRPQTPPSPDPRYNTPSPVPPPMVASGPAGMAGVGRRAFAAAATATRIAVSAQRDRDERQRRQQEQQQGAAGQQSSRYRQRSPPSSPAGPYASPSQSRPNQSPLYGNVDSRTPSPPRARDRRAERPPDPPTKQALPNLAMPKPTRQIDLLSNQDSTSDSKLPFLEKYKQNVGKNLPSVGTTSIYSESSLDTTPQDTGRSQKLVDALKRQREKEAEEEKEIERERARQLEREREREEEREQEEMEAERKRRAKRKEQERKEKEREDREREEEARERERERLRDRDRDGDKDRSRKKTGDNPYGLAATSGRRGRDRSPSDDDSYNDERYDDDDDGDERIEFPRSPSPERSPRGKNGLKPQHSRTKSKSMGVMDRVFDELLDRDPASPTSPSSPGYGEDWDDDAYPKRSITNPTSGQKSSRDQPTTKRRAAAPTEKVCVKCGKTITDGKWIKIDGGSKGNGGVLCEKDWKMMYLPKCRRCDRPIEGQAVGSSDGQIKGKYHRQCFTCDTCEKPFPDTSFYVFDGKPYCAYHYHEANNSLCTASRCGRPIEGPCALAPNGDRYHPEHFTCEYSGGCTQRLDEYWEVEGMKLCDRHAFTGKRAGQKDKAKRRITRFIDLRR